MFGIIVAGKRVYDKFAEDEMTVYAAQVSFFIILSVVPFIMLLLTAIQMIPSISNARFMELIVGLVPGSLGCSAKNDVVRLAGKYAAMGRIHFAHLRNVAVLDNGFEERAHLSCCGSLDMFGIVKALVENGFDGYVRPDHGRMIWGETGRAGYGLYDRALGATYLNGLFEAVEKMGRGYSVDVQHMEALPEYDVEQQVAVTFLPDELNMGTVDETTVIDMENIATKPMYDVSFTEEGTVKGIHLSYTDWKNSEKPRYPCISCIFHHQRCYNLNGNYLFFILGMVQDNRRA